METLQQFQEVMATLEAMGDMTWLLFTIPLVAVGLVIVCALIPAIFTLRGSR